MENYEYPLFFVENMPYIQVGEYKVAISWGASFDIGDMETLEINGKIVYLNKSEDTSFYKPIFYEEKNNSKTDVVLSFNQFNGETFTFDLKEKKLVFHSFATKKGEEVPIHKDSYILPFVVAEVFGHEMILQVDVGDELSLFMPELLENMTPVEEKEVHISVYEDKKMNAEIYDVPVKITNNLTINTKARCICPWEMYSFTATSTHGSIGVDILKNHTLTHYTNASNENPEKQQGVFYFKEF